jgi:3-methylcrotonyl-CoA carboxylase alpha subunit
VVQRRFEFEFHGEPAKANLTYLGMTARCTWRWRGAAGPLVFAETAQGHRRAIRGPAHDGGRVCAGRARPCVQPRGATQILSIDLLAHAGEAQAEGGRLTAPMPGKVVSFAVKAGDKVSKGQPLAVMEAMKMEHTIAAPADGTVQELLYAPGDQVSEGAELLKIAV